MQQKSFDFDISFTRCVKKGVLEDSPSFINFGCKTGNQRHQWISMIEFLRANTIYEEYVNKYVNITFPLRKDDQVEEDDDTQYRDDVILEKLTAFGKNFR